MRLLWLTENYPPARGGMAQSCDRIVEGLGRLGVTLDVVHLGRPRAGGGRAFQSTRWGRLLAAPLLDEDPGHTLQCLWATLSAELEPDARPRWSHVVAFGGTLPLLAAPVYAAWLGVPLVTLLRGNDFDLGVFSPRRRELLRDALVRSARVCVVSRQAARQVRALWPAVEPLWIPNGIELADWRLERPDVRAAERWRAAEVQPGRRVLGLFGHLKRKKGVELFLETLRLSGLAPRFHLLLAGEAGPEVLAWLEAHAGELAFSLLPFAGRFEMLPRYAACDLVVVSSLYDGLPNVVLEAGGLGIPVLASSAGGMADVLTAGLDALLFTPGDPHGLRKALEQAASMPEAELRTLGLALQTTVRDQLGAELEARRYHAALAETPAPSTGRSSP